MLINNKTFVLILLASCLSSCSLVKKVQESTAAIESNRMTVGYSTQEIAENAQAVKWGHTSDHFK